MIKRFIVIFFVTTLFGCSNIEFVYNDDKSITNPLYKKTFYIFEGDSMPPLYKYASFYLGNTEDPSYGLIIRVEEEKTKKSVESDQTVSKVDYRLSFTYELSHYDGGCLIFEESSINRFSYLPKSEGYNFGSDKSLDKLYDLAVKENIYQFVNQISVEDFGSCINEN